MRCMHVISSVICRYLCIQFCDDGKEHLVGVAASSAGDDGAGACSSAGCQEICLSSASSAVTCTCPSDNIRVRAAADRRLCHGSSLITSSHKHLVLSPRVCWLVYQRCYSRSPR